jgi:lipoprotein-releasing system ATP-binding protein
VNDVDDGGGLIVEDLRKEYDSPAGPLVVLKDVSLELHAGQTLAVVGTSGTGKSTLLNIIGSLDRPSAGSVKLDGEEVTALEGARLAEFRSRRVGFVFQDHHLLPQCTALENVLLPTLAAGAPADGAERARQLLERVGLAERLDYLPARLSGGEKQRVAIARAMINGAPLLLCDEPTGNLDARTGQSIADLFLELAREHDRMLIIVTHDAALADRFDTRHELLDGSLIRQA